MVLSTGQLRQVYDPPCKSLERHMEVAYEGLDAWLRRFQYGPRQQDTGSANCRKITGGTGWSLHAFFDNGKFVFWTGVVVTMALAVDINWQSNPYGPKLITNMPREMVTAILGIRTNNGKQVWGWGGYYSGNKDAMHYEIVCSPADLATGLNPATLPGAVPPPIVLPPAPVPNVPQAASISTTGGSMFATCVTSKGRICEAFIAPDGSVKFRSADTLMELVGAKSMSLGGQAKSVNVWEDNGTLVVSVHGTDNRIYYNALGANLQWGGWIPAARAELHA